ncbi:hypothetical protein ACIGB6_10290 [Paeniglutamicibacter gangotriensis]|uniref:hypothetical protein n=1 Tax=Paeniglutamicibacter gangotriensis TaxID=254787 RepID=UPI0037CBEB9A
MDRVAIVYYQRDARAKLLAAELAAQLKVHALRSELLAVTNSSAHELIYFDGMVLIGPVRFSRMHGLALVTAVFGFRPVALLISGGTDGKRILRRLPKHMRGEVPVFMAGDDDPQPNGVSHLVTWLRAMIGFSGYRAIRLS